MTMRRPLRRQARPAMAAAGGLLMLLGLGACGSDGTAAPTGAAESTGGSTSEATSPPADAASRAGEVAVPRFCDLLTPTRIGEAVGATVTTEVGPFDDCEFDQENLREITGSLGTTELTEGAGGYDTYRTGTAAALEKPVEHLVDGIGDGAFLTVGTVAGGESLQLSGGLLNGSLIHTVVLSQGSGHTEAELIAVGERLLRLMESAAR